MEPPVPEEAEYGPYEYEAGNWSGGGGGGCAWEAADWEVSFSLLPALYMLVFVLGLSGNGLVLAAAWRAPRAKRRAADAYLGHLALADLAFVVTLPLWAAYTALRFHWPFGAALCKLSSYLVLLNMFASAFCLGGLSAERYLAVVRRRGGGGARGGGGSCTRRALGAVWLLAALLALPALLLRDTRPGEAARAGAVECDLDFGAVAGSAEEEARWLAALSLATTALGFAGPLLLMTLCYCAIGAAVSRHFQRRQRGGEGGGGGGPRRRLLRILGTLVAVFGACWLPFHLLKSLYVLHWVGALELPCAAQALVLRLHPYATCLAYINSCLNPFLYAFLDGRFRAQCLLLLGLGKARRRAHAGSGSSTLSAQTHKSELPSSTGTKV